MKVLRRLYGSHAQVNGYPCEECGSPVNEWQTCPSYTLIGPMHESCRQKRYGKIPLKQGPEIEYEWVEE